MTSQNLKVAANSLAYGGGVVCTPLEEQETRKIFVGGLIPGEVAQIKVSNSASNFLHGDLITIEAARPERRTPPCIYFSMCGGCNLQYMSIDMQRRAKVEMIQSMLERQGGLRDLPQVKDVSENLPEFRYRRRANFHLSFDGRLGFYRLGSRDVVPIEHCLISEDKINTQLRKLQKYAQTLAPFIGAIEVDIGDEVVTVCKLREGVSPFKVLSIKKVLHDISPVQMKHRGKDLAFEGGQFVPIQAQAGHFSQVNESGNAVLVDEVLHRVTGKEATELYAGSGNFTFALVDRGFVVDAVELNSSLVKEGERLSRKKKIQSKVTFFEMSCEKFIKREALRQLVILDPPRSGALEVVKKARWDGVQSIIYISCNLPSLARDLKILVSEKKFIIKEILFVDMFPQTHHTETITVLERNNNL